MKKVMKSHFLAAFTTIKNSKKKSIVPGKNAYLVNLVPEKVNPVLASKIIWQQWLTCWKLNMGLSSATEPSNHIVNLIWD